MVDGADRCYAAEAVEFLLDRAILDRDAPDAKAEPVRVLDLEFDTKVEAVVSRVRHEGVVVVYEPEGQSLCRHEHRDDHAPLSPRPEGLGPGSVRDRLNWILWRCNIEDLAKFD